MKKMDKDQFPIFPSVNCPGNIQIRIENEFQWECYFRPELRREMEREAVFRYFFPQISKSEMQEICMRLSIYERDSINSVYEKVKDYYFKVRDEEKKQAEQAEMIRKAIVEQKKEASPKKRKKSGRKPRKNYPITQEEAAKLITEVWKELGWGKTCSPRNIRNWETNPKKKPPFSYKKELRSLLETPKSFKIYIKELIFREVGTPNAKKKMLPLSDNSKEASVEPEVPEI